MKSFLIICCLFLSTTSFASMEHIEGQGTTPSTTKLNKSQGCFEEIEQLGCRHPREDREIFRTCLEEKMDSLTPGCSSFFQNLYGKRK